MKMSKIFWMVQGAGEKTVRVNSWDAGMEILLNKQNYTHTEMVEIEKVIDLDTFEVEQKVLRHAWRTFVAGSLWDGGIRVRVL